MRSRLTRFSLAALGVALVLSSGSSLLFAEVSPVAPEIDGSSLSAGLGLIAAGVMILRARARRR